MTTSEVTSLITVAAFSILTAQTIVTGVMAVHFNTFRNIKRWIVSVTGVMVFLALAFIIGRCTIQPQVTTKGLVERDAFPRFLTTDEASILVALVICGIASASLIGVLSAPRD